MTAFWCLVRCPAFCFAGGMTPYLCSYKVRIFDYPRFAQPFRDELRENGKRLAKENGLCTRI